MLPKNLCISICHTIVKSFSHLVVPPSYLYLIKHCGKILLRSPSMRLSCKEQCEKHAIFLARSYYSYHKIFCYDLLNTVIADEYESNDTKHCIDPLQQLSLLLLRDTSIILTHNFKWLSFTSLISNGAILTTVL